MLRRANNASQSAQDGRSRPKRLIPAKGGSHQRITPLYGSPMRSQSHRLKCA